jgi:hypothetical protein
MPPEERREILETGVNGGGPLPEWAERYMQGGNRLVEEMPEFYDSHVFVREDAGTSLAALERLSLHYDVEKDFPRLAALRVIRRLAEMGGGVPSTEFGQYQQAAARAVADAEWTGAYRADASMLRIKTAAEGTETEERETFLSLTLVVINRALFRSQLEPLLWRQTDSSGIRRTRNSFYDRF